MYAGTGRTRRPRCLMYTEWSSEIAIPTHRADVGPHSSGSPREGPGKCVFARGGRPGRPGRRSQHRDCRNWFAHPPRDSRGHRRDHGIATSHRWDSPSTCRREARRRPRPGPPLQRSDVPGTHVEFTPSSADSWRGNWRPTQPRSLGSSGATRSSQSELRAASASGLNRPSVANSLDHNVVGHLSRFSRSYASR